MLKVVHDAEVSNENTAGSSPSCLMRSFVTVHGRCWLRRCRPSYHAEREVTTGCGAGAGAAGQRRGRIAPSWLFRIPKILHLTCWLLALTALFPPPRFSKRFSWLCGIPTLRRNSCVAAPRGR